MTTVWKRVRDGEQMTNLMREQLGCRLGRKHDGRRPATSPQTESSQLSTEPESSQLGTDSVGIDDALSRPKAVAMPKADQLVSECRLQLHSQVVASVVSIVAALIVNRDGIV